MSSTPMWVYIFTLVHIEDIVILSESLAYQVGQVGHVLQLLDEVGVFLILTF